MKGYDVMFVLAKELDICRQSDKQDSFTEKKLQNQTSFMAEKVCTLKFCPILMKNLSHFINIMTLIYIYNIYIYNIYNITLY